MNEMHWNQTMFETIFCRRQVFGLWTGGAGTSKKQWNKILQLKLAQLSSLRQTACLGDLVNYHTYIFGAMWYPNNLDFHEVSWMKIILVKVEIINHPILSFLKIVTSPTSKGVLSAYTLISPPSMFRTVVTTMHVIGHLCLICWFT